MATTSPDNLFSPNPSDNYNLIADWATSMQSVQSALVKRANMYVGTSAQRTAFTTAPEGVHWQDTNGTKLEYVMQSSTWVVVSQTSTTWQSVSLQTGFTGSARVRRVGSVVELRFDISGTIPGDTALTGSVPPDMSPPSEASTLGGVNAYVDPVGARSTASVYVNSPAGNLRATSGGGTNVSRVRGSAVWTV